MTHDSDRSRTGVVQPGDYSFHVTLSAQPSPNAMPGSRIVEMTVWDSGDQPVAIYDRGWSDKPDLGSKDEIAVEHVIGHCRDRVREQVAARPAPDHSRYDDDDRSR